MATLHLRAHRREPRRLPMSQPRPNADQARRLFNASAPSRQRRWWKFGGAGVCFGASCAVVRGRTSSPGGRDRAAALGSLSRPSREHAAKAVSRRFGPFVGARRRVTQSRFKSGRQPRHRPEAFARQSDGTGGSSPDRHGQRYCGSSRPSRAQSVAGYLERPTPENRGVCHSCR